MGAELNDTGRATLESSPVVTTVFEQILAAVHTGALLPGQRINDGALAIQLGVSRTPVREALLRLREIGIVEASASRFTRIAVVTPNQTAQAFVVWLALYRALLAEVIPTLRPAVVAHLEADHADFVASLDGLDSQRIATTNFVFFQRMLAESTNPALRRAIVSVVHIVRLGSLHLPDYIDFAALVRSQRLIIDAASANDLDAARSAMEMLEHIQIPQV